MCTNLVLFADLLRSSEDMLGRKLDGKVFFSVECWSIKSIFIESRIAENIWYISFSILGIPSEFCDSLKK